MRRVRILAAITISLLMRVRRKRAESELNKRARYKCVAKRKRTFSLKSNLFRAATSDSFALQSHQDARPIACSTVHWVVSRSSWAYSQFAIHNLQLTTCDSQLATHKSYLSWNFQKEAVKRIRNGISNFKMLRATKLNTRFVGLPELHWIAVGRGWKSESWTNLKHP